MCGVAGIEHCRLLCECLPKFRALDTLNLKSTTESLGSGTCSLCRTLVEHSSLLVP